MKSKSSTSSAASEGSALDSKEPDLFGQLPSASENRSAKPSCKSTGPTRQSTTMSEPSTQMDLEKLTSYVEGSPANRGVSPGGSEAQKMTEISGRKWLGLLKSYNLDGSLAKMCVDLLTSQWASSAAFLTWKASATKPSHLLFQLAPSMPRTDETGSGLWLTPKASDTSQGESNETFTKRMGDRSENVAQSLPAQVNNPKTWPKYWPTPNATPRGPEKKWTGVRPSGAKQTLNLQTAVKMWPTPNRADHLANQSETLEAWKKRSAEKKKEGINLQFALRHAVQMWPTPRAAEWKGTGPLGSKSHKHRLGKGYLDATVQEAEQVTGQLNPQWVEWLQGYEIGHTDLGHWEMPSSRKSSKKSEEQS